MGVEPTTFSIPRKRTSAVLQGRTTVAYGHPSGSYGAGPIQLFGLFGFIPRVSHPGRFPVHRGTHGEIRTLTALVLNQPPPANWATWAKWYERRDSNSHCAVFEAAASCQLGYARIGVTEGS